MKQALSTSALFATAALALAATAPFASAADAYIESDGTQFMNTGYHPNGKSKIEVDFQLTSTASGKDCVFGNYGDSKFSILLYANPNNTYFQFCGKDGGWNGVSTGVAIDTTRHTMVIDVPKKQGTLFAPDGTVQGTAAFNSAWTYNNEAHWPMAFFASCNSEYGNTARQGACVKIYGAKIWESDDGGESYALVHDYSPVIKGGIAGLLDAQTGTFLYDTRTSGIAFASGGDIPTIDDDPYVESDGTGAINTGVVASPDLKIEIDYAFAVQYAGSGTYQQRLFGQDTVSTTPRISVYVNGSGNVAAQSGDGWSGPNSGVAADTRRRTVILDGPAEKLALLTGVTTNWLNTTACTNITKCATRPLALFGNTSNDNGTTFTQYSKAKVYGLRIWAGGTLIRDFAPRCIDGIAGFEDLVTGKFYTCSGLTASANAATALSGPSRDGDAFIESDGSFYSVVDTRYFINPKTKIVIDYQLAGIVSGGIVLGGYGSAAGISTILWCSGTTKMVLEMHDGNHNSTADNLLSPQKAPDLVRHTAVLDGPGRHVSISKPDGTVESQADFPSSWTLDTAKANWPMLLFGSANSAYGKSNQRAKARIYSVKVYEEGALVHNFTPFVKGGVAGFKDEETGEFFSGDGLTAGGNVQEADDDPYVENPDGGRYFDTGVYATSNTCVVCDFMLLVQQNNQQFPFEAGDSISATNDTQKMFMRMYGNGGSGQDDYAYACGGDMFQTMEVPYSPLVRRKLTLDAYNLVCKVETASGVTVREKTIAAKGRSPVNPSSRTIKLLANANMNGNSCKARLYGFKIYEEGTLTHDYVPICQAGEYALLDKVQGKVLSKASTAAFTGFTANNVLNDAFFNAPMRDEDAYIESDGTQGINLGYLTTPYTRYEIDYQMTAIVGQNRPFGEAAGTLSAELYIQGSSTGSGNVAFGVGETWKGQYTNTGADLNRHLAVLDLANRDCGYSGKGWLAFSSDTECTKTATAPMWLFAKGTSVSGNYSNRTAMKLYAFRIFEAGDLVHEYLPYKVGDVVGLYDTMTGDVITNTVSGSNAFTYGGGLGYGKFAGDLTDLVVTPADVEVGVDSTRTLSAYAPGATSYVWTRNGEVVDGVSGADCTVAWEKPSQAGTVVYGVTPVFTKGGETVFGATETAEVTMAPSAFVLILR